MGDLFVFPANLFIVGHDALGFVVFPGEHIDVRFEGIAFHFELLIFAPQGGDGFCDFSDFRFKLFGFGHGPILLLEGIPFNAGDRKIRFLGFQYGGRGQAT